MVAPKDRLKKLEAVAKVDTPEIVVIRRVITRKKGITYVISELDRSSGLYTQYNPPIPIINREVK